MSATRWGVALRRSLGLLRRELQIALTRTPSPARWVFLVGCYQSGKTPLVRMLGSHADIGTLPEEGQFLTDQFRAEWEFGLGRMWARREERFRLTEDDQGPDPERLKREWGMRFDRTAPVLLEESPTNAARTRWLQQHFENAHFIALVRNGYAVSEEIHRKSQARDRVGWPLEFCAHQWARSNEILLEDADHLQRIIWVRYEDIVERPEEELARLLRFLELDPSRLDFDPRSPLRVHDYNEPLRNFNDECIARLGAADLALISRVAGPMLEHFGYPRLDRPPMPA